MGDSFSLFKKPVKESGIYFLLDKEEIVYIGKSTNIIKRVTEHFSEGIKKFNLYSYIPVEVDSLSEAEDFFIKKYKPKYNIRLVKEKNSYKTINISEDLHNLLEYYSEKTGISIRTLAETAIRYYLKHIKITVELEPGTEELGDIT